LNLGRSVRHFTAVQRRAILARDGGCRCCGAPPEKCEIHHVIPWEDGGTTDITNGVAKCRRCHLEHHRLKWVDRLDVDGTYRVIRPDGTEIATRPAGIDDQLPLLPVTTTSEPARLPEPTRLPEPQRERNDIPGRADELARLPLSKERDEVRERDDEPDERWLFEPDGPLPVRPDWLRPEHPRPLFVIHAA
jgi:hypothetical protein